MGLWGSPSVRTIKECSPQCNPADKSNAETRLVVADVAGAAAIALGGVTAYLYLTRPSVPTDAPRAATQVAPDGLMLQASGHF
jgi:hypothetical protein